MSKVRPLTVNDLPLVSAAFFETFTQAPWFDQWTDSDHARIYLSEFTDNPHFIGYVIEENNEILGASFGVKRSFYSGTEYFINEFFIHPSKQSKGLGSFFMNEIEKSLKEKNIRVITLETERNTPAEKFYEKLNFTASDTNIFYYKRF